VLLLPALCLLLLTSVVVVVIIIVEIFFLDDIQFDWIKSDYFQGHIALFAFYRLAFVRIDIDVNISFTFRAGSSRHFFYLQRMRILLPVRTAPKISIRCSNLTAAIPFLQY
jgi:hypothetical protein